MKREVIKTADGSTTIHLPDWNEQYHSKHGAIQEAYHVFIKHGLDFYYSSKSSNELSLLEIGFGTGLNAFITLLEAEKRNLKLNYCGVEGYPVAQEEVGLLNYTSELNAEDKQFIFDKMHAISWEEKHKLTETFSLIKQNKMFHEINETNVYDIVYFDAFGARVQPELWTESIFKKMYKALKNNGVLVTYSAKGSVRRAMQSAGFNVEKLPGPPGKREMLRAVKR